MVLGLLEGHAPTRGEGTEQPSDACMRATRIVKLLQTTIVVHWNFFRSSSILQCRVVCVWKHDS